MSQGIDEPVRINADEVVWREVGDEVVVLHMSTATYLTINGTGRALWVLLSGGATPAELAAELVDRYGIDRERAAGDVDAFVAALDERGLMVRGGDAGA